MSLSWVLQSLHCSGNSAFFWTFHALFSFLFSFFPLLLLPQRTHLALKHKKMAQKKCMWTFLSPYHFQVILYARFSLFTRKLKHKRKFDGTKLGRQALPLFCSQHWHCQSLLASVSRKSMIRRHPHTYLQCEGRRRQPRRARAAPQMEEAGKPSSK